MHVFCTVHSHVSLHQSVYRVYGPSKAAKQDDDQDNDDQSRKSPAQQEVEQILTVCVLVIHHQHLPEVHRLGGTVWEKNLCKGLVGEKQLCAYTSDTLID